MKIVFRGCNGFTLPEVMVAMTIGVVGAVTLELAFSQAIILQQRKAELRQFQLERLTKIVQWQSSGDMPGSSSLEVSSSGAGWFWQWPAPQQNYAKDWRGYWQDIPASERLEQCAITP